MVTAEEEEEREQGRGRGREQQGDEGVDADLALGRRKRECPVPKPTGLIGQVMGGFRSQGGNGEVEQLLEERPMVIVKSLREKRAAVEGSRVGEGQS